MFGLNEGMSYYVCQRYVNMGLGINGLYKIVSQEMGEPPLGGGVFIFFGKSRQSVKILRWDTDGFVLYHKRLERGTFELPFFDASKKAYKMPYKTFSAIMSRICLKWYRGQSPVPSVIFQISMRTIKILMILMLASSPAMAFNQKVDTVVVSHDSSQVLQIIVTIDNTDNEALWIWLDCNDYSRDSRKAIRRYLMKRWGDFSIFDIATDPNMTGQWWKPSAPLNCFVKYLEPGNTFTFVFYLDKVAKDDYLDCNKKISDVRIFSNQQINEACPGLGALYGIKRISYPHNVIAFPMESEGLAH